jgi:hypothetical protein
MLFEYYSVLQLPESQEYMYDCMYDDSQPEYERCSDDTDKDEHYEAHGERSSKQ